MRKRDARRVAITAYEGVSLLDLAGPLEAFRVASSFAGPRDRRAVYECSVVSVRGGRVKTADGVELVTKPVRSLDSAPIDTLIVPGAFAVDDVTRDHDLVRWVSTKAPSCRRVCSVCVGSFLLAAAGVLDGRRAATHWMHAPLLATRHPEITVEPDAIFVRDGPVWSSAGVTTGIDLALALIEQDAGHEVAMNVARILVVYLKRAGGQSQYSALLAAQAESESEMFSELERWIAEHLKRDLRVDALAERMHMSPRNFARMYAEKRGRTPAKTVEAIRVEAARRLLEETHDRIESIAEDCGFGSEDQMRCAFARILKIPPREYRKRFAPTANREPVG
jgi:transcriptional regulator GlxA family with amidase domain